MNDKVRQPVKQPAGQAKVNENETRNPESRAKRAVAFAKKHGLEVALGSAVLFLGGRCAYLERENGRLLLDNIAKSMRIESLVRLCDEKDIRFAELMSDALRHGSSLAAYHMLDRKEYISQQ